MSHFGLRLKTAEEIEADDLALRRAEVAANEEIFLTLENELVELLTQERDLLRLQLSYIIPVEYGQYPVFGDLGEADAPLSIILRYSSIPTITNGIMPTQSEPPQTWTELPHPDQPTDVMIALNDPYYSDYLMFVAHGGMGSMSPIGIDFESFLLTAQGADWHTKTLEKKPVIPEGLDLPSPDEMKVQGSALRSAQEPQVPESKWLTSPTQKHQTPVRTSKISEARALHYFSEALRGFFIAKGLEPIPVEVGPMVRDFDRTTQQRIEEIRQLLPEGFEVTLPHPTPFPERFTRGMEFPVWKPVV